jgi:hypothetical protein
VSTILIADLAARASARLGSTYAREALARHTRHPYVERFRPVCAPWAHGYVHALDARLGAPRTEELILGHPPAAWRPLGADGAEPVPGTGGHVVATIVLVDTAGKLPNRPTDRSEPIPYPTHLCALHISVIYQGTASHRITIGIPQHGFRWTTAHALGAGATEPALVNIPLDYDNRAPALLTVEREDFTTGFVQRSVTINAILTYRHLPR